VNKTSLRGKKKTFTQQKGTFPLKLTRKKGEASGFLIPAGNPERPQGWLWEVFFVWRREKGKKD